MKSVKMGIDIQNLVFSQIIAFLYLINFAVRRNTICGTDLAF